MVVGVANSAAGQRRAFRWTVRGGMQDLGTLGGDGSVATAVSADGSVVVGQADNAAGQPRAFRWTAQTGMQDLGTLGGESSYAWAVSADGSVVVGVITIVAGQGHAFRWTAQTGMQDLGTLGGESSSATAVSADGRVVVGLAANAAGKTRAFRWTAQTGMQDLGTLGGESSYAWAVSADGSVVVGHADIAVRLGHAFRWTAQTGMQDLNQVCANLLSKGWVLKVANDISPDGRYIVGDGYNEATIGTMAFLLDTKAPPLPQYSISGNLRTWYYCWNGWDYDTTCTNKVRIEFSNQGNQSVSQVTFMIEIKDPVETLYRRKHRVNISLGPGEIIPVEVELDTEVRSYSGYGLSSFYGTVEVISCR